jgi:putative SOS response-associated peptidase YedK
MCGRFARYSLSRELERRFEALPPDFEITPSYNVAPTQEIPVIVERRDGRRIRQRHWGLVPFWAKAISMGARMINARAETVASKPAFRAALRQRRCLIPADGFYEWQARRGGRQPYYFYLPSGEPFAFAGLYETWEDKLAPPGAGPYKSCAIITTEASDSVRDVHDRMPLILKPEAYGPWLDPEIRDPARIERILKEGALRTLARHPVSTRVNRVGNNRKECLEPLPGTAPQRNPDQPARAFRGASADKAHK